MAAPASMRPLASWSHLTPAWLSDALAARFPGTVVEEAAVEKLGEGTNRRASVRIRYAAGSGPARVFVKIQGRALSSLALLALGAFAAEVRLARSGALLPLEHPEVYAAAAEPSRLRCVLVSEDVTARGGSPNLATRPLGVDSVRSGLEGLARLHAAYWERELPAGLGFLRLWRLPARWAPISLASLARATARLGTLDTPVRSPVGPPELERQFRRSAALAAERPLTLLHGDAHPGNTYAAGEGVGFYDWQLVRLGNWSHDVGYFLVSSLDVADRRQHERRLLTGYLEALEKAGAPAPSEAEAWRRYRASPAFGLASWLHTLSAGVFQPTEVCLATIERFAAAYVDLGTAASAVGKRR